MQALRYNIPRFYERMVRLTQVMGAGGILANPTEADLHRRSPPTFIAITKAPIATPRPKIRLSKLAWDATGTHFGQRQLQYERYYAGDPVQMGVVDLDVRITALLAVVERAFNLPPEHGAKN